MNKQSIFEKPNLMAKGGFVLTIPALIFASAGALFELGFRQPAEFMDKLGFGNTLFHPVILLGGLLTALVLNLVQSLQIKFQVDQGNLVGVVKIDYHKRMNLAVLGLSFFLTTLIVGYAFVENFRIVPRY